MGLAELREVPAGPPLTSLAAGAGCGCKLPASALLPVLRDMPAQPDARLLVGAATSDDAAVFRISEDVAIVQTIDFFTPLVDDPYAFGAIAAANALSDIYAMGARPLLALNVVAFPLKELGAEVLGRVLRGGFDIVARAGAVLAGGHSIDDPEPKYGLAVTGVIDPACAVTNAGALPGDVLVLSKPLGVGAVVAARRRGLCDDDLLERAVDVMTTLNDSAASAARAADVHAMTDVTGFGLLGHLHHMCRESGLSAELDVDAVPALEGVQELLRDQRAVSGGSMRNAEWARTFARFDADVAPWQRRLLTDATTSGGLLAAVPAHAAARAHGPVIGRMLEGEPGTILVRRSA